MKQIMIFTAAFALFACAACTKSATDQTNSNDNKAVPPQSSEANKTPAPQESKASAATENYEAVTSPSELGLDVQVSASRVSFGNNPGGAVEGEISSLTIGGRELALTSPEIVQDGDGSWITSKDYGRIKIASGALGRGLVIYLKPSQKESLLKLYKGTDSKDNKAVPPQSSAPKKKFEDMTALEVAQSPTDYGFEKIAEMNNGTMSGRESYNADLTMVAGVNKQWVKHDSDGKTIVLTVHYENDKPSYARYGGF